MHYMIINFFENVKEQNFVQNRNKFMYYINLVVERFVLFNNIVKYILFI